jgi:hypothetical protein
MHSSPTESLLKAVTTAAIQGQLSNPDIAPTIIQIQNGLKAVLDLAANEHPKHAFELLSQIMDAVSTHCETLGLSPDDSSTRPKYYILTLSRV